MEGRGKVSDRAIVKKRIHYKLLFINGLSLNSEEVKAVQVQFKTCIKRGFSVKSRLTSPIP